MGTNRFIPLLRVVGMKALYACPFTTENATTIALNPIGNNA